MTTLIRVPRKDPGERTLVEIAMLHAGIRGWFQSYVGADIIYQVQVPEAEIRGIFDNPEWPTLALDAACHEASVDRDIMMIRLGLFAHHLTDGFKPNIGPAPSVDLAVG